MQDYAFGHAAKSTLKTFEKVRVSLIFWLAFSFDLNLIKTL